MDINTLRHVADALAAKAGEALSFISIFQNYLLSLRTGRQIREVMETQDRLAQRIGQIDEGIQYLRDVHEIQNLSSDVDRVLIDIEQIKALLAPLKSLFETEIVVTGIVAAPPSLTRELQKNPSLFLVSPTPSAEAPSSGPLGAMPILFHSGQEWITGWQNPDLFPSLFGFQYNPSADIAKTGWDSLHHARRLVENLQFDDAIRILEESRKSDPQNDIVINRLLDLLVEVGDFTRIRDLVKHHNCYPTSPSSAALVVGALERIGENEVAQRVLETIQPKLTAASGPR